MRDRQFAEAERLLTLIEPGPESILPRAAVAHIRGANLFHGSELDRALLHEAREHWVDDAGWLDASIRVREPGQRQREPLDQRFIDANILAQVDLSARRRGLSFKG